MAELIPSERPQLPTENTVRAGVDVLGARNDEDAVGMWIKARGGRSAATRRAYTRIGKRLLVWLREQGLTLEAMTVAHAQDHLDALRHPAANWLIPTGEDGALKAPLLKSQTLKQPMTEKGIRYTRTVLIQLSEYLRSGGYMRNNVFALTEIPSILTGSVADKTLTQQARKYLWDWLVQHDEGSTASRRLEAARERWVCALLYHTGIRNAEAVAGRMGDFVRQDDGWQLQVVGKGNKSRRVTVDTVLARELLRFRLALGTQGWPHPKDETPLVPSVRGKRAGVAAVSPRMLHRIIEGIGDKALRDCTDPHVAEQLRHMSPHWMRHSNATHRLAAGARLETTQEELGHADPKTTLVYAKIADKTRRRDAERLASATMGKESE